MARACHFSELDPLKVQSIKQNSLLVVILAKLMFIDLTEELASITCFVSCAFFDMGHTAMALHPRTEGLDAWPLPIVSNSVVVSIFSDILIAKK